METISRDILPHMAQYNDLMKITFTILILRAVIIALILTALVAFIIYIIKRFDNK